MTTHFLWVIEQRQDERNWPTPQEAIEAAKGIGGGGYISLFVKTEDHMYRACSLDLNGKPTEPFGKFNSANMHVVKYAKDHYEHSDNLLHDLARILIAWSGLSMKPEDVRLEDIFNHVHRAWEMSVPRHQRELPYILRDHFSWEDNPENLPIKRLIEYMLSGMRFSARGEHPDLPAGNPAILPLDKQATKEGWNEPILSELQ